MLTVYKASAGSGKTFRLAVEYVKRLIMAPTSHEGILAVTFTNKATEEMKTRILSTLYSLSRNLPEGEAYLDVLLAELPEANSVRPFTDEAIDAAFVRRRAAYALRHLLHHYTFFQVETIDSFFQRILRNLARELDLARGMRIELRDTEAVDEAVDLWIESLAPGDHELEWILDYVSSTMDENKGWNIIGSIKKFSRELLDDDYKKNSLALNAGMEDERYDAYCKTLSDELRRIVSTYNESGKRLCDEMQRCGVGVDDLFYKAGGIGGFIQKMSTEPVTSLKVGQRVQDALNPDDVEANGWVARKAPLPLRLLCRDVLKPALVASLQTFDTDRRRVASIELTLLHLSKLRMLRAIQGVMDAEGRASDRFLLSDTQMLLHRMIAGSDAPFIYEKTGSRLRSIMIDEFQDTSSVQWQNFKVLLTDCMSHGHDNLIVGDVKQSIYRWRKGDWRILADMEHEFPTLPVQVLSLDTNYRSSTNVISFNNAFFRAATTAVCASIAEHSAQEAALVEKAYSDVEQRPKRGRKAGGYVEVRLIANDEGEDDEAMLDYVSATISRLVVGGESQSDIAVIVRRNEDIKKVVAHCTRYFHTCGDERLRQLRFISDEAYILSASPAVTIIIDALRLLIAPSDPIARARLASAYHRYVLGSDRPASWLATEASLPPAFTEDARRLRSLPLYQLCEEIYDIFSLSRLSATQGAYVCTFLDGLAEYLCHAAGDISYFLEYWEDTLSTNAIETPKDCGIRILTIHKSKGLEYDNVILPFCDWSLEIGSEILWCVPGEAPMNQLPVIPIAYAKTALGTIYEDDYWYEHSQKDVDNLNLLYVAFTRAARNLFIASKNKGKNNASYRGALLETVLPKVAEAIGADFDGSNLTYGELLPRQQSVVGENPSRNVFTQVSQPLNVTIETNATAPEFRESNNSQEFLAPADTEGSGEKPDYIALGNAVHYLLSTMRTASDLERSLSDMEMSGMLGSAGITREALAARVRHGLERRQIADWFSDRWLLHSECTILERDAATGVCREHRPDRVMTCGDETIVVDFKLFRLRPEYTEQVRRYMRLLTAMGRRNVRGFLWAVMTSEVVEIKDV